MLLLALAAAVSLDQAARARVQFNGAHIGRAALAGLAARATDHAAARPLRADDPVRVASISKLAVAMTVMRLVDAGKLDLDRDASAYLGWPLRNPGFPDTPITLRQLLSHTSSVRDGAGYLLPLDDELGPFLANPAAWDPAHAPGAYFTYTNLNFPIVAAILEAATGERFDRLAQREVFAPLRLDACYNWSTCTPATVKRGVTLYRPNGDIARDAPADLPPACPGAPARDGTCDLARYRLGRNGALFSPQGGMRIAVTGLARLGGVLAGAHPGFLSPAALRVMTTPTWRYDGSNGDTGGGFYCAYGLGVMILNPPNRPAACRDDPFGDGKLRVGHAGDAYSLKSGVWVEPATGRGLAYYVTAVAETAPPGSHSAFTEAEEAAIAPPR